MQQAVQAIKAQVPELLVVTDVCLCAYTTSGHCGLVQSHGSPSKSKSKASKKGKAQAAVAPAQEPKVKIDYAATLDLLTKTALSHAQAGADIVAPSDMMEGRVAAIRKGLDHGGFGMLPIMSYAAKFASSLYAPFRQAVDSAPLFGDRKPYQLDVANAQEALREVALDIDEGADIVMVKPALAYLDVISRIKCEFQHPVAAFSVSGEYAMVKAASARGWLIERPTWLEILLSIRRAGADVIVTYWAKDAAKFLQER